MNPIRDSAIWAASLLPADAPQWAMGTAAFAGIIGALVAIAAPACIIAGVLAWQKEKRHERI